MSISAFLDSVVRDLRQTLRGLQRRPTFTLTVVLTLAQRSVVGVVERTKRARALRVRHTLGYLYHR